MYLTRPRTVVASSPTKRFVCLFVVCLFTSPNYRSTKLRSSRSKSSHFSPTTSSWSTRPRTNKGYSVSTPMQQEGLPLIWFVQYLIIYSNKWLFLNISRTLQIHDQGDSHNLLSVGWSFKMANKWSLINATWGNAQHLLFLLWTIDKNGWFWYFYWQDLLILPKQRINILGDACHFGDEKQQNGSPNQQNVNPYQQSGSQKREISWYISTIGV